MLLLGVVVVLVVVDWVELDGVEVVEVVEVEDTGVLEDGVLEDGVEVGVLEIGGLETGILRDRGLEGSVLGDGVLDSVGTVEGDVPDEKTEAAEGALESGIAEDGAAEDRILEIGALEGALGGELKGAALEGGTTLAAENGALEGIPEEGILTEVRDKAALGPSLLEAAEGVIPAEEARLEGILATEFIEEAIEEIAIFVEGSAELNGVLLKKEEGAALETGAIMIHAPPTDCTWPSSKVTAPSRANTAPFTPAPESRVMEMAAIMFPTKAVVDPSVAELPTAQRIPHGWAPLMKFTEASDAVVNVEPMINTK